MTGLFRFPAVGPLTCFGEMSGDTPGASLTPGTLCFCQWTQLEYFVRQCWFAPASSLPLPPLFTSSDLHKVRKFISGLILLLHAL